jgi:hypothetical protein
MNKEIKYCMYCGENVELNEKKEVSNRLTISNPKYITTWIGYVKFEGYNTDKSKIPIFFEIKDGKLYANDKYCGRIKPVEKVLYTGTWFQYYCPWCEDNKVYSLSHEYYHEDLDRVNVTICKKCKHMCYYLYVRPECASWGQFRDNWDECLKKSVMFDVDEIARLHKNKWKK